MIASGFILRQVSHRYGDKAALDAVSFELPVGVSTAILGPSGCGKTTVLRLLAGLEAPSMGQVLLNEQIVSSERRILVPPHQRAVAMVFQDLALWPNLTAMENVTLALSGARLGRRQTQRTALEALEACGIKELAACKPAQLSGGQQQRVAIARAMVGRPSFLLMDEPFSSLDLILKHQLFRDIAALAQQNATTLILVTHDPLEAKTLCDKAIILDDGRLVESGSFSHLMQAPSSRFLQLFQGQLRLFGN